MTGQDQPPPSPAPPSRLSIMEAMRELLAGLPPPSETPAALQCHPSVIEGLRRAASAPPPPWYPHSAFGIPIFEDVDFQPGEWRIIATDGSIIESGIWDHENRTIRYRR